MYSTDYSLVQQQFRALVEGEHDTLANSANFVALLFATLPAVNWVGIYVLRDTDLVLGPFQGRPACVRIPLGQGVCGTAARDHEVLRVANVHEFDGHIACDPESRSELVVPLAAQDRVLGVLDIDSPELNRFSAEDQLGIEQLCALFITHAAPNLNLTDFI